MTVAFVLHSVLHFEPSVVALDRRPGPARPCPAWTPRRWPRDVEWPTLIFFAGLFIMVGALVNTGAIDQLSQAAADAAEGRLAAASVGLLWGSAVLSAVVDNIPYVATMSPVVADMVSADGGGPQAQSLWWSLAIGADLGGNATAVGASANVVILGLAEKAGHRITFWEFTKYGLIVAFVTIALATPVRAAALLRARLSRRCVHSDAGNRPTHDGEDLVTELLGVAELGAQLHDPFRHTVGEVSHLDTGLGRLPGLPRRRGDGLDQA